MYRWRPYECAMQIFRTYLVWPLLHAKMGDCNILTKNLSVGTCKSRNLAVFHYYLAYPRSVWRDFWKKSIGYQNSSINVRYLALTSMCFQHKNATLIAIQNVASSRPVSFILQEKECNTILKMCMQFHNLFLVNSFSFFWLAKSFQTIIITVFTWRHTFIVQCVTVTHHLNCIHLL